MGEHEFMTVLGLMARELKQKDWQISCYEAQVRDLNTKTRELELQLDALAHYESKEAANNAQSEDL